MGENRERGARSNRATLGAYVALIVCTLVFLGCVRLAQRPAPSSKIRSAETEPKRHESAKKSWPTKAKWSGPVNRGWPMQGHDSMRTNRSPHAGPKQPVVKWRRFLGKGSADNPVVGPDGAIYFLGTTGLVALDPNGKRRWTFQTGDVEDVAYPAIGLDHKIYFPSANGIFYFSDGVGLASLEEPAGTADARLRSQGWLRDIFGMVIIPEAAGMDLALLSLVALLLSGAAVSRPARLIRKRLPRALACLAVILGVTVAVLTAVGLGGSPRTILAGAYLGTVVLILPVVWTYPYLNMTSVLLFWTPVALMLVYVLRTDEPTWRRILLLVLLGVGEGYLIYLALFLLLRGS